MNNNKDTNYKCILCNQYSVSNYYEDKNRSYLYCSECKLVFVPKEYRLSSYEELFRYNLHQNNPNDANYRNFLSRLFLPLNALISSGSQGLDFGSGPGPTLSIMLNEAGHNCINFDYYYANNPDVFNHKYDFITASEVVEHLFNPRDELFRLWNCLKPGGVLGIMTKQVRDKKSFEKWHYKNDLTHVSFFSRESFSWLKEQWNSSLDFINKDVVIFQKKV